MPGANILIGVLTVWHYDALQMERTIKEQADKIKELEKRKVCRPSLLRWTRAPAPHWRSHFVLGIEKRWEIRNVLRRRLGAHPVR